jgi:acetyltransferase-like isoleucine patch superfamily enzyme
MREVNLRVIIKELWSTCLIGTRYSKTSKNEKGEWMVTFFPIELGERSWIGAWCSIGRGVVIGKDSIVSGRWYFLHLLDLFIYFLFYF